MQASNKENIRFYEKNGLKRICLKRSVIRFNLWLDFYFINEQWEDGILFFYPYHNATIVVRDDSELRLPLFCILSLLSIVGLFVYSIYKSSVCSKQIIESYYLHTSRMLSYDPIP